MGCYLTIPQRNFIIGGGVSVVFAGFIVAYKARKFSDPFGIMQEVKYVCIGGALSLILFQIALFYPDGSVSPYFSVSWLSCLTMIAAQQATCTYQVYKAYKDPRGFSKPLHRRSTLSFLPFWKDDATAGTDRKESIKGNENQSLVVSSQFDDHGGPSITSLPQELRLILDAYTEHSVINHSKKQHSDALFQEQLLVLLTKFEEYLLGEFAVENLRMYLECDKWQRAFNDLTDSTRRSRARRIITLFVETDSMFYVNLPANIRDGLIDAVNNKDTAIHHDLFKQSQREMFHILLGSYTRYVTKNPNVSIHRHQQLNKDISP